MEKLNHLMYGYESGAVCDFPNRYSGYVYNSEEEACEAACKKFDLTEQQKKSLLADLVIALDGDISEDEDADEYLEILSSNDPDEIEACNDANGYHYYWRKREGI